MKCSSEEHVGGGLTNITLWAIVRVFDGARVQMYRSGGETEEVHCLKGHSDVDYCEVPSSPSTKLVDVCGSSTCISSASFDSALVPE